MNHITKFLLSAAAVASLATAAVPLHADVIRLGDIFTSGTVTIEVARPPVTLDQLDAGKANALLAQARAALEAGRFPEVLGTTELLSAWFPRKSAEYEETIYLRGRAFHEGGDNEHAFGVTALYRTEFKGGKYEPWFLVREAEEARRQGKLKGAAENWKTMLTKKYSFSTEDGLEGAEILLAAADPVSARAVLTNPAMKQAAPAKLGFLLLESQLLQDDPKLPIPAALSGDTTPVAVHNLRRALLLELRGDRAAAKAAYAALKSGKATLPPGEQVVLDERAAKAAVLVWPPTK